MIVPRISLKSVPFDLPIRLAVRPLGEKPVRPLAAEIQANTDTITITPGAFYILSNIAGRRVVNPIRWVLLDSLRDILTNGLPTVFPERQDLLASTFGEMLGAIVLAINLGSDVEIVRLLDSSLGTTPDFLILENANNGQVAHLLECKGTVKDVVNVNERGRIDLCSDIRSFRKKGRLQLENVTWSKVRRGQSVIAQTNRSALADSASSKNLAVVCVPDERLLRMTDPSVSKPRHSCCDTTHCLECVKFSRYQSNVIAVLYREGISPGTKFDNSLSQFVSRYRNAERAKWSRNDAVFAREFNQLTASSNISTWQVDQETVALLATGLIEAGILEGIDIRETYGELLTELVPEDSKASIDRLLSTARSVQETWETRRSETVNQEKFESTLLENQWIQGTGKLLVNNLRSNRESIYGSAERDERSDATVTRLSTGQANENAFNALRDYAGKLISSLRGNRSVNWQDEYVESIGKRIELGVSWDEFPYPNPSRDLDLPGITAWVSRDGRAEIIVRRRTD